MRLVYLAAVREAVGRDGEDADFPVRVITVSDALDHLAVQSPLHAAAFANRARLRFALDQHLVKGDAALGGAAELAIFPPVTGG
jgi:sulfur-carrier protein